MTTRAPGTQARTDPGVHRRPPRDVGRFRCASRKGKARSLSIEECASGLRQLETTVDAATAARMLDAAAEAGITMIDTANGYAGCWFGGTTWNGKRAMCISVVNWQTNDDVTRAVAAVRDTLAALG